MAHQSILEKLPFVELPLHGKHGKGKTVLVDGDYDGDHFAQYKWRMLPGGSVYRAWNKRDPDHPGKWLNNISYLAREVTNAPDNMWVGYLDGNKQNCRSYNLVLVTPQESCLNRRQPTRTHVRPSSGYRGVIRAPRMASYYVQIKGGVLRDSDDIPIKFPDPADAARAYDAKAKEYWGDKAVLNFPH